MTADPRSRLEAMALRTRANAEYEADECVRLARGLNLAGDPVASLSQAESLARSVTALVKYLSALDGIEFARAMLVDAR